MTLTEALLNLITDTMDSIGTENYPVLIRWFVLIGAMNVIGMAVKASIDLFSLIMKLIGTIKWIRERILKKGRIKNHD